MPYYPQVKCEPWQLSCLTSTLVTEGSSLRQHLRPAGRRRGETFAVRLVFGSRLSEIDHFSAAVKLARYEADSALWKVMGCRRKPLSRGLSAVFSFLAAFLFVSQTVARHGEQLARQRFKPSHRFFCASA